MDGRKEKRTPRTLRVLLSSGTQPAVAEYASTENVSPYGARIRTDRPWKRDTSVLIKSTLGEPSTRARVVYCRMLKAHTFVVGLEHRRLAHARMKPLAVSAAWRETLVRHLRAHASG